jgi:hypothetical protein
MKEIKSERSSNLSCFRSEILLDIRTLIPLMTVLFDSKRSQKLCSGVRCGVCCEIDTPLTQLLAYTSHLTHHNTHHHTLLSDELLMS